MSRPLPQSVAVGLAALHRRNAEQIEADRRSRGETIAQANARAFARECGAAGLPPTSTVSPALLARLDGAAEHMARLRSEHEAEESRRTAAQPVDTDAEIPEAAE